MNSSISRLLWIVQEIEHFAAQSQYIFSLSLFVVMNRDLFRSNSEVPNTSTR